ncbi:hypothetical protein DFH06DRAFT_1468601 [Mycena polygramma]|nr:hypothetical protein DFH06DRAFT_1468601 [Mycena polygramma]
MRVPFRPRKRKASSASTKTKITLKSQESSASQPSAVPDLLSTSVIALKESADAFPPLKSAVGGVLAVCDIAQRAKHSRSAAHDIAIRTQVILNVISDAVNDPFVIPHGMLSSILRFTDLLNEIESSMNKLALTSGFSRVMHLNRNERELRTIRAKLDDAYRDFLAASALRVEAQQAEIAVHQSNLEAQQATISIHVHNAVQKTASSMTAIALDISSVLFYSRLQWVLFGQPQ